MKRLLIIALLAGCYNPNFAGGKLDCASGGKCPDGYYCAPDNKCYKNGTTPPPGTPADMSTAPTPTATRNHTGSSTMSGAVTAHSANYKVIMSTGQGPGSNGTASSQNTKLRGGVIGATQDTR
jgi:hypothetical protein